MKKTISESGIKCLNQHLSYAVCKFENLRNRIDKLRNKMDKKSHELPISLDNNVDEYEDNCEFIQQQVDLKIIMQMNIIKNNFNLMQEEASFLIFIEKIRKNNKARDECEFIQQQVDLKIIMQMNMLTEKFILMQSEATYKIFIERRLFRLRRKISIHLYNYIDEDIDIIDNFYQSLFLYKIHQLPSQLRYKLFHNMSRNRYININGLQQFKKVCNLSYYKYYKYYNIDWIKNFDEDYYNALEFWTYRYYIEKLKYKVYIYFNYIKKLYKHKVIYNIGKKYYKNRAGGAEHRPFM